MIYAYRRTLTDVDLYVSETGKAPPNGYTVCTLGDFREAWRFKDAMRIQQLCWAAAERSR